jgi:type II secretory pathway component PulL
MSTDSEVENVESQQIQVYRRLFPTGPKPKNVRRRLESELAAIEQTMGQQDATPPDVNASWVWLSLLNRLMSADNYRIDEMTIANSEILSLTGSATSYADVEDVYNTLREGGFEFQISNASMNDGRIQLAINRAKLLDERLLEERRIDP